ncbi:MAG: hypothetical protein ABIA63_06435 [bacterium]
MKKRISQKESNKKLVSILKEWQKIESRSIAGVSKILGKISNPLVKEIFKIIKQDSINHKNVQQFIVNSLEKKAISLTPEELGTIWTSIEEHIKMERATIALGQEAKAASSNFVHRYLINYLLTDERKHDDMLEQLENLKKKIYPYA